MSVTPSSSESNWVTVEEHEAQVIPPTESVRRSGPSILTAVISEGRGFTGATSASYPMVFIAVLFAAGSWGRGGWEGSHRDELPGGVQSFAYLVCRKHL